MHLLAISGSLRSRSTNTDVLRAAARLAPHDARVTLYAELAELPPFNPDLDEEGAVAPAAVERFRASVAASDALLICSPEYAHGVPGALKNALDWLVSSPAIVHKRVTLINVSPRSMHAVASLAETLRTMSAVLVPGDPVTIAVPRGADAGSIAADPEMSAAIRRLLSALLDAPQS